MANTCINDLINEWSGEVVFGTCQIQVMKFTTDANGTLFFVDGNKIGNPSGIRNGVYEACFAHLLDLNFDNRDIGWMDGPLLLVNKEVLALEVVIRKHPLIALT